MDILFIGKRFYTNRDALKERFGRIYQLPSHWAKGDNNVELWLVDYHTREKHTHSENELKIVSTPVLSASFIWHLAQTIIRKRPAHIVASGDCYVGLLGYFLSALLRSKFSFDIYDKYDEFKGYRRLSFFDPLSFLIKKSHLLVFASNALLAVTTHNKKILAPNGIDTALFRPLSKANSRDALALPQQPIYIGYFGSMEPERGIEDLLAALKILRAHNNRIELLLGGKISDQIDVTQDGVRYLGNIDFDRVPLALGCCNILVLPYRNSAFLDMASSCKIAEYIALQVPIVTTRTPNILSNFPAQAEALGELMPSPQDPTALAAAILLQLDKKLLVEQSPGMTWEEISEKTLALILEANDV